MKTKTEKSIFGGYLNPISLIRDKVGLPVLAVSLLGFTAMWFGSGLVHEVGSLLTAMYVGILTFGWFLDDAYLNSAGIKKAMKMRYSDSTVPAQLHVDSWNRTNWREFDEGEEWFAGRTLWLWSPSWIAPRLATADRGDDFDWFYAGGQKLEDARWDFPTHCCDPVPPAPPTV